MSVLKPVAVFFRLSGEDRSGIIPGIESRLVVVFSLHDALEGPIRAGEHADEAREKGPKKQKNADCQARQATNHGRTVGGELNMQARPGEGIGGVEPGRP